MQSQNRGPMRELCGLNTPSDNWIKIGRKFENRKNDYSTQQMTPKHINSNRLADKANKFRFDIEVLKQEHS